MDVPPLSAVLDRPTVAPELLFQFGKAWEGECLDWSEHSLADKHYVYMWVDRIHFNIRLEEDRQCSLLVMFATEDGKKELIAVHDGYRESDQAWKEVLLALRARGLDRDPKGSGNNNSTVISANVPVLLDRFSLEERRN